MPKNVMKLLKPSRNVGRNAFDLSHRHLMTANFGELLPITCIETVPGDYIEFRVSDLLRAMPFVTSPFLRAKQHIDVWYTSYDDLWHNFEQFITMKQQPVSSALQSSAYCPSISLNNLWNCANRDWPLSHPLSTDVVGRDYTVGAKKLLDYLGYGRYFIQDADSDGNDVSPRVNIWRILQYNKIWYDEYRQQYYDNGKRGLDRTSPYNQSVAQIFNVDDVPCDSVAHSDVASYGQEGYRVAAMLQMRYRLWKKDLYTGALPSTQFGNVSTLPILDGVLIENRVYGNVDINGGMDDEDTFGMYIKSRNDVGRWRLSDGSNLSDVYTTPNVGTSAGNFLTDTTADSSKRNMNHDHTIRVDNAIGVSSNALSTGGLDILALRKSEAIQIWRENALRAGNRVSDNLRAHYGDDAEYNDHRSTLLGSVSAPLNIGDIDSHAQTGSGGNQQLADVAGKGLSSTDEKVFKFKAHKFGCIMVMFSMLPEAEYQSDGVDRMNQLLEMEDYFISEYQNTGLEAISSQTFYRSASSFTVGYAPAYVGYKQKLDKCFETFKSNQPNAPWASPKTDVSMQFASGDGFAASLQTLYVDPKLFNRNFGIAVTGTPSAEATTEQFLCDFYFDVNAVRAMSVVGLPQNS